MADEKTQTHNEEAQDPLRGPDGIADDAKLLGIKGNETPDAGEAPVTNPPEKPDTVQAHDPT